MAQKINPEGYRLSVNKNWHSRWHADRNFSDLLKEDTRIREYINDKVSSAGIDELRISRSINEVRIDLKVARPGLVIGRGGVMSNQIKKDLGEIVDGKLTLNILEVSNPNLSPVLAVESITGSILRRYPYKRAINSTIKRVMDAGAKGVKVFVSGRLGGNRIARTEKYHEGSVPTSTLNANVRFAKGFARTKYGTVGVKVWITQPDQQ